MENAGIHPKEINWFFGSRISVDVHKKSHDFFPVSVHNILFYDRGVFTIRVKKKLYDRDRNKPVSYTHLTLPTTSRV